MMTSVRGCTRRAVLLRRLYVPMCLGLALAASGAETMVVDGVLSPGNSPGCVLNQGSVVLNATATLTIEIADPAPCTGHDRVTVQQSLTINGATLRLILLDDYQPPPGAHFDILDWGSVDGAFARIDFDGAGLPDGLAWDTARLLVDGTVAVVGLPTPTPVPIPGWALATLAAMIAGAANACGRRVRWSRRIAEGRASRA